MQNIGAIGTSIMNGATRTGGTTTIRTGFTIIIRNGPGRTRNGASTTAIGMTIMCGATVVGGTRTIRNGYANIIMIGFDGTMTMTNQS